MAHIVGQLEASHVCDVLAKCVLPIHLPKGRGRRYTGPAGLPQIWLPWVTDQAILSYCLSHFAKEFRKSLFLPSPLRMHHVSL